MLIARAGDGSMRDAQSAFDQVIAFAGTTITAEDVATVLGLVRRDLLIDIADAVAARGCRRRSSSWPARAVESGYDLRLVVRELAAPDARPAGRRRSIRRGLTDPEIAAEASASGSRRWRRGSRAKT